MATYSIFFRPTDTGLTPTFAKFVNRTTLADLSGSAPVISEVGFGEYKFTYAPTVDVSFAVDGGVSLPSDVRYVSGVLEVGGGADLAAIADAVWDEPTTGHNINNSFAQLTTGMSTQITRALGLMHENSVLDLTTFTGSQLSSGRLRLYDSKANADAAMAASPSAYNTGKIAEYAISATYAAGLMTAYKVSREA